MNHYYEEIIVPSTVKSFSRVENFIERICDTFNINFSYSGNILTCLSESFTNAVNHGNTGNISESVCVAFEKSDNWLHFSIEDKGKGFDYQSHIGERGEFLDRGLFLIQTLSDKMEFSEGGRKITISFDLDLINKTIAETRQREMELLLRKGISVNKPS